MDEIKNKNTKANQAWRRKPRKFSPKSRLGCKTCKIRRVKCDLSQPSCLKCQSTGRTCDGYSELPFSSKAEIESPRCQNENASRSERCSGFRSCATMSAYRPKQRHAGYNSLSLENLRPLMVLPVTGSVPTGAMCFFEYISVKHLNGYHPCESWRNILMFFSQTVPSVRSAAVAVALMHRNYMDRDSSDLLPQPQSLKGWPPEKDKAPLLHYNRAIQLLLDQELSDSTEITAITLLVCYLLTCFDQLAGNYVQAIKHLRGGVEILRKIDKTMLNNNDTYDDAGGVRALICQVTKQIRRLDMQAATAAIDWTPADIQETFITQPLLCDNAFQSLDQAADHLQTLIAQVMRLRNTEQHMSPTDKMPPSSWPVKHIILGELETWSSLFENMPEQGISYEAGPETHRLISLLRLQCTTAWTYLSSYGPGREMEYDNFLPQFQQCVALAADVAGAHERYSESSKPAFTPDIGIVPVLYIIGAKCRHPVVRREALSILRRHPIREAVWDSMCVARVVERIIEIEQGGCEEGGQIPVWQRIETVSWVHVVNGQSAGRADLRYTFCEREGTHAESLMI